MPEHAQTCLYKPEHACTTEELPSQKRKRGSDTFPRLRFGLAIHAADVPFLTACRIARQIMESRIQFAQFEAASAAFAEKGHKCPSRKVQRYLIQLNTYHANYRTLGEDP